MWKLALESEQCSIKLFKKTLELIHDKRSHYSANEADSRIGYSSLAENY